MTSTSTKTQDGPDLRKQMLAGSVQRSSALLSRPCDSKFWSEVDSMFAELDCSWY